MARTISYFQAEREFDLLFDEYFKDDVLEMCEGLFLRPPTSQGDSDRLESGSIEADEVYVPDEQLEPRQVDQREAISLVAQELRSLGDEYVKQYGPRMAKADNTLTALFKQVSSLEYDTFKNTVESLQSHDRNAANFAFMMCLSRSVVSHVGNAANKAKNFFRHYIGDNYIAPIAEAGGVREYVRP